MPQSRGMEAEDAALRAYYERGMERERLSDGRGDLEFTRIVRPGGPLFAAAITRWAARIDGMLREQLYLKYPVTLGLINEIDRTGMLPLHEGAFTAFCHRPVR